ARPPPGVGPVLGRLPASVIPASSVAAPAGRRAAGVARGFDPATIRGPGARAERSGDGHGNAGYRTAARWRWRVALRSACFRAPYAAAPSLTRSRRDHARTRSAGREPGRDPGRP